MSRWLAIALLLPALCWGQDELNSESGLVGRWLVPGWQTGNGAEPTKALDVSRTHSDGSLSGSVKIVSQAGYTSMALNGTNTTVFIPTNSYTVFRSLTICGWWWFNSTNTEQTISGNANSAGQIYRWAFTYYTNKMRFGVGSTAGNYSQWRTASMVPLASWVHIAFSQPINATSTPSVYINGKIVAVSNNYLGTPQGIITNYNINIGRFNAETAGYYVNGYMRDFRIYDRALPAAEIKSIYEQGLAPK